MTPALLWHPPALHEPAVRSSSAGRLFGGPDAAGRLDLRGASRAGKREGSPALKEAKEQEKDQMHREELKTQRDEIEALQQQLEAIKTHTQLEEKKPKETEPRTKFLAPSP